MLEQKRIKLTIAMLICVGLAGCMPSGSNQAWSNVVFISSQENAQRGCTAAISQSVGNYIGQKSFASANGNVNFMSSPGQIGIFCQIFSFGLQTQSGRDQYFASEGFQRSVRDSNAYVVVFTKETDANKISLVLSLEDKDGKEFALLKPATIEGVSPGIRYDFDNLSSGDVANIAKTNSFTILVNRGAGEEKFRVTPSNLDPFSLNR
jgi:hypothetical protein